MIEEPITHDCNVGLPCHGPNLLWAALAPPPAGPLHAISLTQVNAVTWVGRCYGGTARYAIPE